MRKSPYIGGVGRKRNPLDQCYFYISLENGGSKEESLQLDEVKMGQVYVYPEGSGQSNHGSFRMIAEEGRPIFHPFETSSGLIDIQLRNPVAQYVKRTPSSRMIDTEDSYELVRGRMEMCLESHRWCEKPSRG